MVRGLQPWTIMESKAPPPEAYCECQLLSEHNYPEGQPLPTLAERVAAFERDVITAALERAGGIRARAARELGLTYRGFTKKVRRLGL